MDEFAEFVGTAEDEPDLLGFRQLLADPLLAQHSSDLRAEAVHDRPRRAGGSEKAPPGICLKAGETAFDQGRDIGKRAGALVAQRTAPGSICGIANAMLPINNSTWPATRSFMAGPPPR